MIARARSTLRRHPEHAMSGPGCAPPRPQRRQRPARGASASSSPSLRCSGGCCWPTAAGTVMAAGTAEPAEPTRPVTWRGEAQRLVSPAVGPQGVASQRSRPAALVWTAAAASAAPGGGAPSWRRRGGFQPHRGRVGRQRRRPPCPRPPSPARGRCERSRWRPRPRPTSARARSGPRLPPCCRNSSTRSASPPPATRTRPPWGCARSARAAGPWARRT
mmetsp:Transcript_65048/g.183105  ORF Transcript_65048/g.183105 Transcript_65048/m.183105 type:complete len:218 (-) Transcript_65048:641-1294(-)